MVIECIYFKQEFKDNEVMGRQLFLLQERLGFGLNGRYHATPSLVSELLVKKILFVKCFIPDKYCQQVSNFTSAFKQEVPGTHFSEKTGCTVSLYFPDGGKECFVPYREIPDGNSLIKKAADDPKENRVHQGIQVHLVVYFPVGPEHSDSGRWSCILPGKYFLLPFRHGIGAGSF